MRRNQRGQGSTCCSKVRINGMNRAAESLCVLNSQRKDFHFVSIDGEIKLQATTTIGHTITYV